MRLDDAERVALLALGDEVGDDRRLAQQAQRLDGDQFRIAGADAQAEQTSVGSSFDLRGEGVDRGRRHGAAAAPALHDRRTARRGCRRRASALDSAAPTKPTGKAEDQRRLRRAGVEHFQQVEQGGRRVADHHHAAFQVRAPQLQRRGGAGVADASWPARARVGSSRVQITRLFAGRRARVTPSATMCAVAQNRRALGQRLAARPRRRPARSAGRRRHRPCRRHA